MGRGHGWTSNTALDDGKRASPAFNHYKEVLASKVGAERAQQILTRARSAAKGGAGIGNGDTVKLYKYMFLKGI